MSTASPDTTINQGAHVGAEAELRDVPHILLPYQQEWLADDAPLKIYEKSRRIGISWAEAADAALHASTDSGSDVFYLAYNQDMTRQFIQDCAWWAKWFDMAASAIVETEEVFKDGEVERSIKVFEIHFASGHKIQALSSKPRNLRSKQGRVIFDEFAFHDDPDGLLKAAMALRIWGGTVRIISTHNGISNSFYKLIDEVRSGKRPGSVHRTTFDDAVDEGLFERICLIKGWEYSKEAEAEWKVQIYDEYGSDADEELGVVPSKSGGKYFSRTLVEARMDADLPVIRFELNDEWVQYDEQRRVSEIAEWCELTLKPLLDQLDPNLKSIIGEDFGRSADLTVLKPAQITRQLVRRVPFAVELRNVPFEAQKQIVFYVIDRLPRFVSGAFDHRGNGSFVAEVAMQRYGSTRIHLINATAAWYLDYFPKYRSGISDGAVLLPADSDLLDDHGDVELVGGVPKVPQGKHRRGADGKPRHADAAIAGVMMWYASLHQGAPIEFMAAETREGVAMGNRFLDSEAEIDMDTGFGIVTDGLGSFYNY